jgi:hypothetical protein
MFTSRGHFCPLVLVLFCTLIIATPASAKRHHRHASAAARTEILETCESLPKVCSDESDRYLECTASVKGQRFEEGARDSDNLSCIKMRLWKKICAEGLESEHVKVNCR